MTTALLDTSVIIDLSDPAVAQNVPDEATVCAITVGELQVGVRTAASPAERAKREQTLRETLAEFEPLAYDVAAAESYGRAVALVRSIGRDPRRRVSDLQIAAIAHANQLPLYTRNPTDFVGLAPLVDVVPI